jgi:hypothetical protein
VRRARLQVLESAMGLEEKVAKFNPSTALTRGEGRKEKGGFDKQTGKTPYFPIHSFSKCSYIHYS